MTSQANTLMRIVYFSRDRFDLSDAQMAQEIDNILVVSRANNARDGLTGALLFSDGVFGQVLEGPSDAVEETFERIQLDDRHAKVTLLEIGSIAERSFCDWSMGYVGQKDVRSTGSTSHFPKFDISLLTGQEIFGVLHKLMIKKELRERAA